MYCFSRMCRHIRQAVFLATVFFTFLPLKFAPCFHDGKISHSTFKSRADCPPFLKALLKSSKIF